MAAMAPVASTSNPVAPRALPSWGSRRLARACDGRGGRGEGRGGGRGDRPAGGRGGAKIDTADTSAFPTLGGK